MLKENILENNQIKKLNQKKQLMTSCEFKDTIDLDFTNRYSPKIIRLGKSNSSISGSEGSEDHSSYELSPEENNKDEIDGEEDEGADNLGVVWNYDDDNDDFICFETCPKEQITDHDDLRNSSDEEECSYEDSSSCDSDEEIEYKPQVIQSNNDLLIKKMMDIESNKSIIIKPFPKERLCNWFGNEDVEQIEEIFISYTKKLDPEKHLKNFKRGLKSYVGSIKREPIVPINNTSCFQTLDTIIIYRKDLSNFFFKQILFIYLK